MQERLLQFAQEHLYLHIVLISLCCIAILVAMALDLVFGLKKAKENGKRTTSRGLKMTSKKAFKYLGPFISLTLVDIISSPILPAPFFAMIWSAWCVLCEFWSIREKSWEKAEIRDMERTIKIAASDKDDIAKLLADLLSRPSKNEDKELEDTVITKRKPKTKKS